MKVGYACRWELQGAVLVVKIIVSSYSVKPRTHDEDASSGYSRETLRALCRSDCATCFLKTSSVLNCR